MAAPFRDDSEASRARVEQLAARVEELEIENARLRARPASASDADLAKENVRLKDAITTLRVALESRRRDLARAGLTRVNRPPPNAAFFLVVLGLVLLFFVMLAFGSLGH